MKKIMALVSLAILLFVTVPVSGRSPALRIGKYIFPTSDLKYQNVSKAYAESIFIAIKEMIYRYLGAGDTDRGPFYDMQESYPESWTKLGYNPKLLKLSCAVTRNDDIVNLAVRVTDYTTEEDYYESEFSACFFTPNILITDFSSSFAERFTLPIVNEYNYVPNTNGYSTNSVYGIKLGDVMYPSGESLTDYGDLIYDFQMTENIHVDGVLSALNAYTIRKQVERNVFWISGVINIATFLVAGVLHDTAPGTAQGNTWQQFLGIGWLASAGVCLFDGLAILGDRPSEMVRMLNDESTLICK
jgi:hypothetical protein